MPEGLNVDNAPAMSEEEKNTLIVKIAPSQDILIDVDR